jgi:hypothetical protein
MPRVKYSIFFARAVLPGNSDIGLYLEVDVWLCLVEPDADIVQLLGQQLSA